jgi:uncharacterized protein (TIGR03790 family)
MTRTSLFCKALFSLLLGFLAFPALVSAGGGPENMLLVVNPQSAASLCIANHYAKLRQIPPDNILFLPWDPKADTTNIETFRKQILIPILQLMQARRLGNQIDAIVYSSDFPWAVDLHSDAAKFLDELRRNAAQAATSDSEKDEKNPPKKIEWPQELGPTGSINGLTYLWQPVLAGTSAYFNPRANQYMRLPVPEQRDAPSVGFRGNRLYNDKGEVVNSNGQRYFLSMMLGVTAGRGNSLPEVLSYLQRSAAADGTRPKRTIYYVRNDGVRSKAREQYSPFPIAVEELRKLGVAAEILQDLVPRQKPDVLGVVMGTEQFDWINTGSTILPGAICENFTSYGGVMTRGAGQTPLTEVLRYGAAGASGTVAEPIAIPTKFPSAMIQVHYARGCTLIESYYQSVWGPYQLLIAGDPLCRPWADIPQVTVKNAESIGTVQGRLILEPSATVRSDEPVERFELFIDGVRMSECKPDSRLTFDTTRLADGCHELRVVAIGPRPIESQGRQIMLIHLANHDRKIEASLAGDGPWSAGKPLSLNVASPGAVSIVALHGSRVVARINADKGKIDIPANILGAGPVRLRVIALGKSGTTSNVAADPIDVTLQ